MTKKRSAAHDQQELANATVLPRRGLGQRRALWEAMGIKESDTSDLRAATIALTTTRHVEPMLGCRSA